MIYTHGQQMPRSAKKINSTFLTNPFAELNLRERHPIYGIGSAYILMYTDELEKQLNSISDLISVVRDQINTDAFAKTRESMAQALQPLAEAVSHYFTPEYQDRMAQVAKQFSEAVKPLLNLSPQLGKVSDLIRYYNVLDKTGWPLYAVEDKELYDQITTLGENLDHEKVAAIAIDHLEKNVIDKMMVRWRDSAIVGKNHFPAIREAIELYYSEKYFGCTSILACKMNGIIRDIFAHHENDTEWVEKVRGRGCIP